MGSAVIEFMADHGYSAEVKRLGIKDQIYEHGSQLQLHTEAGFNPKQIAETCIEMVGEKKPTRSSLVG